MTRAFRPDPVPAELIADIVDLASRAPSAGKTQGWHLVLLEGNQTSAFWSVSLPEENRHSFKWPHLLDAPVLALVLADPSAYLDRYSEHDKRGTGLGDSLDRWPAPYWTIDAAMAAMTILLAAQERGLGALLFGIFNHEQRIRESLAIPETLEIVAALAIGYPLPAASGRSAGRRRRTPDEIIHRGRW